MSFFSNLLSTVFERGYRRSFDGAEDGRPIDDLAHALISSAGEVSGLTLGKQILREYSKLNDGDKRAFFLHLAQTMNIDPQKVRETLDDYEAGASKASYRAFASAAEPPRQELFRRLNQVPGATGALVEMRADLRRLGRGVPELEALDLDFRHMFASWFNRGFLVLRPIDWSSPANILEKIIAYEAVHAIDSWDDLRLRLRPDDRRCFAFFHPVMSDEPLIFVEVALTKGIPSSVQALLAEERTRCPENEADTAVFYSISNCQKGLSGISFGNSLIKQVAFDLAAELPGLKKFVTLSPIPGLCEWAASNGHEHEPPDPQQLLQMAAFYLLGAKQGDGLPIDPVARFHLGNGARVHALHARADTSEKGREQSAGAMVNYLYELDEVAQNHESFANRQEVISSQQVKSLAQNFQKGVK